MFYINFTTRRRFFIGLSLLFGLLPLPFAFLPAAYATGPWYVAPTGADANDCLSPTTPCASLNATIGKASAGDTLYVASGVYTNSSGAEVVLLNKNLTLSGGWDSTFISQTAQSVVDAGGVRRGATIMVGVTAHIERFTIQNGDAPDGSGVYNMGVLTLTQSIIQDNPGNSDTNSGLNNLGVLYLSDSVIQRNGDIGLFNSGQFTGVRVNILANAWRGVFNSGQATLNQSAIVGNQEGAIDNDHSGLLRLNTTTVAENVTAFSGPSGALLSRGQVYINNSTIVRNHNLSRRISGVQNEGSITLRNTLLAENEFGDCLGTLASAGYNLLGNSRTCEFLMTTGDLVDVAADLVSVSPNALYYSLSPSSSAIDAGNPAGCTDEVGTPFATDQRGLPRAVDGNGIEVAVCDIGAYEVQDYTPPGPPAALRLYRGTLQSAEVNSEFPLPFQVKVLDADSIPVSNTLVLFTAPANGPSGVFTPSGTLTATALSDWHGVATAPPFTSNAFTGTYTVTATQTQVVTPVIFLVDQSDQLTQGRWYVAPTGADANNCLTPATACASLSHVVNLALDGDTIYLATGVYTQSALPDALAMIETDLILSGGWDSDFTFQPDVSTLDGAGARRVLIIAAEATVQLENLHLIGGYSAESGGGLFNSGMVTLTASEVSGNMSEQMGGGIFNEGQLTILTSIIHDNQINCPAGDGAGGGVFNAGYLTLDQSEVAYNRLQGTDCFLSGGGLYNGNTLQVLHSNLHHNQVECFGEGESRGGGLENSGSALIAYSQITENFARTDSCTYAINGGGLANYGTLTLNNSLIKGNHTFVSMVGEESFVELSLGGGVFNGGTFTANNSTLIDNHSGGYWSGYTSGSLGMGGGVYNRGVARLQNTVLAYNTTDAIGPDCIGEITSAGHNLVSQIEPCLFNAVPGDLLKVDPELDDGRPRPTSPVIDAGDQAGCAPFITDYAGAPRIQDSDGDGVAVCDIGAYERTFTPPGPPSELRVVSGAPQQAPPSEPFAFPLQVRLLDSQSIPIANAALLFTAPSTGPSLRFAPSQTLTATVTTDVRGYATTPPFSANALTGTYAITGVVISTTFAASFQMSNLPHWRVALTGDDTQDCLTSATPCATFEGVWNKPDFREGDTILVASGVYSLNSEVRRSTRLLGGWDATFTQQAGFTSLDGHAEHQVLHVFSDQQVYLERFIIQAGVAGRFTGANWGGGIFNEGHLTLHQSLVRHNASFHQYAASADGGGIFNVGVLTVSASAIVDNFSASEGRGAGIANDYACWFHGCIFGPRTLVIVNSVIARNSGGAGVYSTGDAQVLNTTFTANDVGLDSSEGIFRLKHSLLADNVTDCAGRIVSAGYNLIQALNCELTGSFTGVITNTSAQLLPRAYGQPDYYPLRAESPAIDAGDPTGCTDANGQPLLIDQRGAPRTGPCDLGAYEYHLLGQPAHLMPLEGDAQHTRPGDFFRLPLTLVALNAFGAPLANLPITFTAPLTGASGVFTDTGTFSTTVTTDEFGMARAPALRANETLGVYSVTATAGMAVGQFDLGNWAWYLSPTGDDRNVCYLPTAPCASLKALKLNAHDVVLLASGVYTSQTPAVMALARGTETRENLPASRSVVNQPSSVDDTFVAYSRGAHEESLRPAQAETAETFEMTGDIELSGGWDAMFTQQEGYSILDGEGQRVGLIVGPEASVTLERFVIQNATSGLLNQQGRVTVRDSLILSNTQGGLVSESDLIQSGHLTVERSEIRNNQKSGIRSSGLLTITDSLIESNVTTGSGGGVLQSGGTLVMFNSVVKNNSATGDGGGIKIDNYGPTGLAKEGRLERVSLLNNYAGKWGGGAHLWQMTLSQVVAQGNAAGQSGGGLYGWHLTLNQVLAHANQAGQDGGGLFIYDDASLTNVTLSQNTARISGGGIYLEFGPIVLANTTIIGNVADSDANNSGEGGGLFSRSTYEDSALRLRNSIVANNLLHLTTASNCRGIVISLGYNLISNTCALTHPPGNDLVGRDPLLSPLQDHGGWSWTHALFLNSPAIDAGDPAGCQDALGNPLTTDQRGIARPQGARCDIGAYEALLITPTSMSLSGPTLGVINTTYTFTTTVSPITATLPISYLWQATGQTPLTNVTDLSNVVSFNWDAVGAKVITVTAYNGLGAPLTTTHSVTIVLGALITLNPATSNTLVYTDLQGNPTSVFVPAGAVTQTMDLLYSPINTMTLPSSFAFAGHAFSLEPYQAGSLLPGFALQTPITINLNYSDIEVTNLDEETLTLTYWNGSTWLDVATTCAPASVYTRNLALNQLSVPVCHLTKFALLGTESHRQYLPLITRNP